MSRQAWLSFLGLYQWDNTLFDYMVLPEDFTDDDKAIIINNLLMESAELEVLYPEPDFMKNAIGAWSSKEVISWTRLYKAMLAEYDPIENYNRKEKTNNQNRGSMTHSGKDTNERLSQGQTTNSITSFDNNNFQPHDLSVDTIGDNNSVTYGHVVTDSTGNLLQSEIHGNIGVTTSQQMLEQELEVTPKLNIYNTIIDSFIRRFCLLVY